MKYVFFWVSGLILLTGCSRGDERMVPTVDSASAWRHTLEVVKFVPRHAGTSGHAQAVEYIARHAPCSRVDSWVEPTFFGTVVFKNIQGEIQGKDSSRFVIVGSHFDTKQIPGFAGANDGASSTGGLLAMLEAMERDSPPVNVRYYFFDGEESFYRYGPGDGLHGSTRAATGLFKSTDLTACEGMILLDMIGDKDLKLTLSADTPEFWVKRVAAATAEMQDERMVGFYRGSIHDDHVPFEALGIRCIDLIDFDYRYWHTPEDTPDKISPTSIARVSNLALRLIWGLSF